MGWLNPSRETKFSGTHGDRGILIFLVQPTTSRIGNLTRWIHTLLYVMSIHTYIYTYKEQATRKDNKELRVTVPYKNNVGVYNSNSFGVFNLCYAYVAMNCFTTTTTKNEK